MVEKPKYSERNLQQSQSVNHTPDTDWHGIELKPLLCQPATNAIRHVAVTED
jgi:hypothetical protein